jgi:hypothetical protein
MNKLTLFVSIILLCLDLILLGANNITDQTSDSFIFNSSDTTLTINTVNKDYVLRVKKSTGKIKLDGIIDEPDWIMAQKATDFYMVLPYDTSHSVARSEVMMTYDDKAFYLAVIFHDTVPGKRPVESLKRDFYFSDNDNFLVFIDTYNDQTTGYSFGVNAAGAVWDGTMSDGGKVNLEWDCKWESKTKNYDDRWISEMRIPFKSVRYKSGVNHWNIQFSRLDLKLNEKSAWAPVPRQFPTATLAYSGVLKWDTPPPKSGLQLSLIPYLFGGVSHDYEENSPVKYKKDFGFDAKVGLSSSLNLDLTYNPDFSQAEVDDQVINLDRFELFYPEKRQFFLENSDLFADYGSLKIRPFFSRRIGLDAPVLAGARLSGKIGNDWRLGIMDMQTQKSGSLLARNYFVASLQKKVFSRSNIGAIFVNKQNMDVPMDWDGNNYNRVVGLEYNLASKTNFWTGKLFGQRSFTPGVNSDKQYAQGVSVDYERKKFHFRLIEYYVGEDFNAEVGYVPRKNFLRLNPKGILRFYPKSGGIEYHGVFAELDNFYLPNEMELTDREIGLNYFFRFKNRSSLRFNTNLWYVKLLNDYDPSSIGDNFLPTGSDYKWFDAEISFESDNRKTLSYLANIGNGDFFNGNRSYIEGELFYRYQPYINISLYVSYNKLTMPSPWVDTSFLLFGPHIDVTFTNKLFFTTYIQYNEQEDNININARFQWRYKPASDFFLVYTDNYFPNTFNARNRAIVAKLSYWFN